MTESISIHNTRSQMSNPVRKVVDLLMSMQKKVQEEGKRDAEIHEQFVSFCNAGTGNLQKSIDEASTQVPQLESTLKESQALHEQHESDLKIHKKDLSDAQATLDQSSAIREKEKAAFTKQSDDAKTNIKAIKKAIVALKKGMVEFMQLPEAAVVKHLVMDVDFLSTSDRDVMTSFFAQKEEYNPQSGDIVGILQTMLEQMEKELTASTASEAEAAASFSNMVAAKQKEIEVMQATVQKKHKQKSDVQVKIESVKADLQDTTGSLEKDKAFIANFDTNCDKKKKLYESVKKARTDELLALAQTIKMLNDDDALELFKKTLQSPSLVQMKVTSRQMKEKALKALHRVTQLSGVRDPRLDLIALALHGQKVNFDKVKKMIDDMLTLLAKEQKDDDQKKASCIAKLDKHTSELKANEHKISDLEKDIADLKSNVATQSGEISELENGIKALDKQVGDGTQTRKEEHDIYQSELTAKKAAKELLLFAKNRLYKYYNPKLYKAPPKEELSEMDRVSVSMGGTLAPTTPPAGVDPSTGVGAAIGLVQRGGAVFMQLLARSQSDDLGVPAAVEAYKPQDPEKQGVIAMINILVTDLDKEIQQLEVQEKDSQGEYEQFIKDSADKRTADGKSMAQKEKQRADLASDKVNLQSKDNAKMKEAYATTEIISELHKDCDWLLSTYDARKQARAGEMDSLEKAKAVLSGAAYSLMQAASAHAAA